MKSNLRWFLANAVGRVAFLLLALVCLLPATIWAQDTATIAGTVSDSSGAVMPGVTVTVSNPDRGFVRVVASNSAGEYTAVRIPIGNYVVSVEAAGFQKLVHSGIALTAGQTQRVDLTLTVGQVSQQVEVVGNIAKVETENATISDVVTSKQIDNLALNGADVMGLMFLVPGAVQPNGQGEALQLGHSYGTPTVSFNGNRAEYSQFEFDGGNNAQESSAGMGGGITPPLDSVAEFRISTSNYGADVGQHAGALIEVVSKGGTKDFHGSAHEFVRNQILDANDWFANRKINPAGGHATKTPLQWNIFGYTVGGPFYIPGHYNTSKQKTFFFWSQEWAKYRAATIRTGSVPTARMRQGDFSECDPESANYLGGEGQYPQYFDSANCTLPSLDGGNTYIDTVTPVNNNGAAWLNAYVPLPNNGPVGYIGAHKVPTNFSNTSIRVDQNINDKASLFVRVSSETWVNERVPALWTGSDYDTTSTNYKCPARQAVLHINYNVKPTLMNEFIMSYTDQPHFIQVMAGPGSIAGSIMKPSDWSASTFFAANATNKLLPGISLGGGTPFGWWVTNGNYVGPYDAEPLYTYRDNVAWIHGKHTIKFGFFLEKFQLTEQFGAETQGDYTFDNGNPLTTGNALADMFLGKISNYTEGTFNNHGVYTGGYGVGHWRRTDFEPYLQDDWKVNRKLTINFGVRYYLLIPPHDVTKPTVDSSFVASLYNPAFASVLEPNGLLQKDPATGHIYDFSGFGNGLVECGAGPIAKGCQVPYKFNIGPRFGFAFDPTGSGKTSIRAGYGIYYEPGNGNDANTIGLEGNAPTTVAPIKYTIDGYDAVGSGGFAGVGPGDIQSIPYFQKNPAVSQYNLNVQHEFRGNNILTVAYVGTQGRHLDTNRNLNQLAIPVGTMTVPAMAGASSWCDANGTCDVQNLLIRHSGYTNYFRYFQGFGNIRQKQFTAVSGYHALQANFRHTTGYGLTLQAAYTWSHMIDNSTSAYSMTTVDENYNMSRWKGTSDLNRAQVLMLNYIYDLPFFKNSTNKFAKQAIGGWRISGVTELMSGSPTGFYGCGVTGYSHTGIGGSYQCNTTGPLKIHKSIHNDPTYGPTVRWFDPSVVSQPTMDQLYANGQSGMFGFMGRNVLTGPGRNNWDLALFKEVSFPWFKGEHSTLQVRLETFNSFNHPQWEYVSTGCNGTANADGSPAFGRSCGGDTYNASNGEVNTAWSPRNIQLGMKFLF